jgi:hypothetical protein
VVADGLAPGARDALAGAARDAFERGAAVAYITIALLAALCAAVASFSLPSSRPGRQPIGFTPSGAGPGGAPAPPGDRTG